MEITTVEGPYLWRSLNVAIWLAAGWFAAGQVWRQPNSAVEWLPGKQAAFSKIRWRSYIIIEQ